MFCFVLKTSELLNFSLTLNRSVKVLASTGQSAMPVRLEMKRLNLTRVFTPTAEWEKKGTDSRFRDLNGLPYHVDFS